MDEIEREFREWFLSKLNDSAFSAQRSNYEKALLVWQGAMEVAEGKLVEQAELFNKELGERQASRSREVKEAYLQGRDSQARGLKSRYDEPKPPSKF